MLKTKQVIFFSDTNHKIVFAAFLPCLQILSNKVALIEVLNSSAKSLLNVKRFSTANNLYYGDQSVNNRSIVR